jgi:PAS domain S-box-containing protein
MGKKRNLIIAGVLSQALLIALILITSNILILGSFTRIEADLARKNMSRVMDALSNELDNLENAGADWAEWDDAYSFVAGGNREFVKNNLPVQTFANLKVDLMIFVRLDGRISFGKRYDPVDSALTPISEDLRRQIAHSGPLFGLEGPGKSKKGLLLLPEGPLLLAVRPVLTSEGKGPIRGNFIIGRYLDAAETSKLSHITHTTLSFVSLDSVNIPVATDKAGSKSTGQQTIFTRNLDDETIAGYGVLHDLYGKPALVAHVKFPRDIYSYGKITVLYFIFCIIGLVTASSMLVLFLSNKLLLSRKERQVSEERYHAVIQQASDGFLLVDPVSGAILEANVSLQILLGYSAVEFTGLNIRDIVVDEHSEGTSGLRQSADVDKQFLSGEGQYRRKNGSLVAIETNSSLILHKYKDVVCISVRDITERKTATDRFARLNDCFLSFTADPSANTQLLTDLCGELMGAVCALFNRIDAGMLCTKANWNAPPDFDLVDKPDGHICADVIKDGSDEVFLARNLQQSAYAASDPNVTRYKLQTYIGVAVKCNERYVGSLCVVYQHDYIPTEDDKKFLGILASAVGIEEERRIAAEALLAARRDLEERVRERTDELSAANKQLSIDILERLQAEEALEKSRNILSKVFEAIPDLLEVLDKDLRIVHSNWHGGYDYVSGENRFCTTYCYEAYYPGQKRPCDDCHALEVLKTGKPVFREKTNIHSGTKEVRAYPIFDESGQVVQVAIHIRDITTRKKMEEEILKSQKLESLGVLAGGIAHDFNNLLTGILGNISLTKMYLHPEDKGYVRLEEAEKASERARDLTQQLLTFSKGGAPVKKTTAMQQIILDSSRLVLSGSNVRCEYHLADDLWLVEVDEGQMSQVINNLIINANQAMPDGGKIVVSAANVVIDATDGLPMKPGRYVKISIVDHGIGIAEDALPKIFDPYYTTKKKGNGLGLATVYSILKNHDGHIIVESRINSGTTFSLYLPGSENCLYLAEGEDKCQASHLGTGRILVMDDEEVIREVASEMLEYLGYRVDVCGDGAEALELYRNAQAAAEPFAAVIMDLTVPGGMGGREAVTKLLEIDQAVKVIVSSGYSSDPVVANYRDYGFCGVVAKPYKIDDLGDVLRGLQVV